MLALTSYLISAATVTSPYSASKGIRPFASALQILAPKQTSLMVPIRGSYFKRPILIYPVPSATQTFELQQNVRKPEPSREDFTFQQSPLAPRNSYNLHFHRVASLAAEKLGAKCITPPDNTWIGHFEYNDRSWPYVGFDVGLNSSAAKAACDDKTVTSALLKQKKIPHIEHRLFMKEYTDEGKKAVWSQILTYFQEHNCDVVMKPRAGTCGRGVCRIQTEAELKTSVDRSFEEIEEVCLCPYYKLNKEYRQIILAGKAEIVFIKHRPFVTGNGIDTLEKLIHTQHPNPDQTLLTALKAIEPARLTQVPIMGETVNLNWKHNLCSGARAELIEPQKMSKDLQDLAMATYRATGACFASVDIAELEDGSILIMEVNNGVMFEFLAKQHGKPIIEKLEIIFEKALQQLFFKDS